MIKWEHSIFALPFAFTAVLLAGRRALALAHRDLDSGRHASRALLRHGLESFIFKL
jgi:hypothetical protein